jgi:peptidoglycan/xylan/chitin deacetylase (PgdA/CDA1 family)
MSITRGQFLRSLGKSLPGFVASTGVATAAEAIFRRAMQASPPMTPLPPGRVSFLHQVQTNERVVALTFNDGPVPGITERLLDALAGHDGRATFFMTGEKVAAAPELARRVLAEGHELGLCTQSQRKLTELPDAQMDDELDRAEAVFHDVLGAHAAWFRPPFGSLRQDQARRIVERGMQVALWSVDAEDWRAQPAAEVTQRIIEHVHPGAIVVSHEAQPGAESLKETLAALRDAGYRWTTLSELVRGAANQG